MRVLTSIDVRPLSSVTPDLLIFNSYSDAAAHFTLKQARLWKIYYTMWLDLPLDSTWGCILSLAERYHGPGQLNAPSCQQDSVEETILDLLQGTTLASAAMRMSPCVVFHVLSDMKTPNFGTNR